MTRQSKPNQSEKSGQEVAKQDSKATLSKYHSDYWKDRLFKKTYTRDGVRHEVPEWSVRLQHLGRREAFSLSSANAITATSKAKEIAGFLEANGWDRTIEKFKPKTKAPTAHCTLGQFLTAIEEHSHLTERTARIYATKLRKLVADVSGLEDTKKLAKAKFDYVNGGNTKWKARVDETPLGILTAQSIASWRNNYVSSAGTEPSKRKSAERSAASILRAGRALFSSEITPLLQLSLPQNPFAGVKVKDPGPQRYHSDVNPEWLLGAAERELRKSKPEVYLGLFLCLWAGLRRKEADCLTWKQVDLQQAQIHICRTDYFEPKTEESSRTIDLAPEAVDVLRGFMAGKGEFVLDGGMPDPAASYGYYRCDRTWRDLISWLKVKGVSQRNAIHTLRKESGSLVAASHGIEAARQHLGHRNIATTSAHYVDKKKRVEVRIGTASAAAFSGKNEGAAS